MLSLLFSFSLFSLLFSVHTHLWRASRGWRRSLVVVCVGRGGWLWKRKRTKKENSFCSLFVVVKRASGKKTKEKCEKEKLRPLASSFFFFLPFSTSSLPLPSASFLLFLKSSSLSRSLFKIQSHICAVSKLVHGWAGGVNAFSCWLAGCLRFVLKVQSSFFSAHFFSLSQISPPPLFPRRHQPLELPDLLVHGPPRPRQPPARRGLLRGAVLDARAADRGV